MAENEPKPESPAELAAEARRVLFEEIGSYSVQCAKTGELAPSKSLLDAVDALCGLATIQASAAPLARPLNGHCAAGTDGDCFHKDCPQLRDNEPHKSGRSCPLEQYSDED